MIDIFKEENIDKGIIISKYGVPCWCDFFWFYDKVLSKATDGDIFVELGTFLGGSFSYLVLEGLKHNKNFEFHGADIDVLNTQRVIDYFGLNKKAFLHQIDAGEFSRFFANDSVFMVFLDASHEYDKTFQALHLWWDKIKPGGFLAGHDYGNHNYPGVMAAVDLFSKSINMSPEIVGGTYIYAKGNT